MKNHPSKTSADWIGMNSATAPDRIDDRYCAYLRNGHVDRSGRIVKTNGVSILATASSFGLTATSASERFHTLRRFTGQQGQHPHSKAIACLSTKICRSQDDDLKSRWDDVTYATTDETPTLDRPMAIDFRLGYAYMQNGTDMPMRLKCEQADGGALTTQAETLGLRPPAFGVHYAGKSAGDARRFPPLVWTSYVVTFVYGTRGESGPSCEFSLEFTTGDGTNDTVLLDKIPLGPSGCTARRIYRSPIGRGAKPGITGTYLANRMWRGPSVAHYLLYEISDNTTTSFNDNYDDAALDFQTKAPQPRPLVPRAKYQTVHLGRFFWANVKDHPWTIGFLADPTRTGFTDYRITISNTGNGTITFEKNNAGWSTDLTISNYKTKSLRTIIGEVLVVSGGTTNALAAGYSDGGLCAVPAGGIDIDRKYTFNAVTQQSIMTQAYWAVGQDDVTGADGPEVHTNRFFFADPVFPEQVDPFNSDDLTQGGSNEITGMSVLDNALMLQSFEDTFAVSGTFIPDLNTGIPEFRVDRVQATAGNICQRPDAVCSVPELGNLQVTKDGLRRQRGESSVVSGEPVYDWFARVLREPPSRDSVSADYDGGVYRLALPVDESP